MRKLIITAVTMAMATSMVAVNPTVKEITGPVPSVQLAAKTDVERVTERASEVKLVKKEASRAGESARPAVCGEYDLVVVDYSNSTVDDAVYKIEVNIAVDPADASGVVLRSPAFYNDLKATFDATTNKLTVTGTKCDGEVRLTDGNGNPIDATLAAEPFVFEAVGTTGYKQNATASIVGDYDATTGTITFAKDSGIRWAAYKGEAYVGNLYVYEFYSGMTACVAAAPAADPEWVSVGEATFNDPWLAPYLGVEAPGYVVEIEQNVAKKTLYRLVEPYKGNSPMAAGNESVRTGYIMFDLEDPNHVVFHPVLAGYMNSEKGIDFMYCGDLLSYYMFEHFGEEKSREEVVAKLDEVFGTVLGTSTFAYTTFKDGVISIPKATYGDHTGLGYTWRDAANNYVKMEGSIVCPAGVVGGVDEVTVDGENGAPEYYNLQGMKVENPGQGLYIKCQGSKVVKVIM